MPDVHRNGLRGRTIMEGDYKGRQIQQSITRAVELYLSERYDETGFCYVKNLTISKDGRRVTVFVKYSSDPGDVAINRARLTELMIKQMKLRFVPKVEFINLTDES